MGIISYISQYFTMYKNFLIIGAILSLIGYHFYIKLSLESAILEKDKKILKIEKINSDLTTANNANLNTIANLEKDFEKYENIFKIKNETKEQEISKLKEILKSYSKKIVYEHTYSYENCEFKISGDKNETDPIIGSIKSIGN